ncbi:inosineuridine preferring nucleoside hydrolase [Acanthamoeba castellanii str. Neff]|uniref:Inosineuridine preferring nucleoside hydrolase n=1 Tax=Acanthamoeba castellanii (strain ATCC 30010 / Neff) TaxID=1257118 RepID=L8H334_ACACF|nr:inosineuridine preferring nucleoside hydrolase [Acanthamoeba castellanii str. Neff]ELR19118.1 inosineuridine preferring nucleoside hydrolase [Acanthamoeba castellanii str. Neff]
MAEGRPRKVIVDTDGGIDDLLALALALKSPEVEIIAITTVHLPTHTGRILTMWPRISAAQVCGNVPVDRATSNIQLLFHYMQKQEGGNKLRFPHILAVGAPKPLRRLLVTAEYFHGEDGVGGITTLKDEATDTLIYAPPQGNFTLHHQPAVDVLLDLLRTHEPGEITILTIGPLTNIALAAEADIETLRRVHEIVIMGGAFFAPGNVTPHAEYNIYADPEAAKVVCEARLPLVFVPLDATHLVPFAEESLRPWSDKSPIAKFVTDLTAKAYGRKVVAHCSNSAPRFQLNDVSADTFHLHDPVATVVAIDEEQRMTKRKRFGSAVVDCTPEFDGKTTVTEAVVKADDEEGTRRAYVDVVLEVETDRVLSFFMERVLHP